MRSGIFYWIDGCTIGSLNQSRLWQDLIQGCAPDICGSKLARRISLNKTRPITAADNGKFPGAIGSPGLKLSTMIASDRALMEAAYQTWLAEEL